MARKRRVLFIGHSFIRRVKEFIDKGKGRNHNFNLVYDTIEPRYISFPGGRVNGIRNMIRKQLQYRKSMLAIVMAGGNDLDGGEMEPGETADKLLEIAQEL